MAFFSKEFWISAPQIPLIAWIAIGVILFMIFVIPLILKYWSKSKELSAATDKERFAADIMMESIKNNKEREMKLLEVHGEITAKVEKIYEEHHVAHNHQRREHETMNRLLMDLIKGKRCEGNVDLPSLVETKNE